MSGKLIPFKGDLDPQYLARRGRIPPGGPGSGDGGSATNMEARLQKIETSLDYQWKITALLIPALIAVSMGVSTCSFNNLKGDVRDTETRLRGDIGGVRQEVKELRSDLKQDFKDLKSDLVQEIRRSK